MHNIPWVLAVLTGVWFGWQAQKGERFWPLWSLGGGSKNMPARRLRWKSSAGKPIYG